MMQYIMDGYPRSCQYCWTINTNYTQGLVGSVVLLGAERFMASWHKIEEEASRLREVNRVAKELLVSHYLLL